MFARDLPLCTGKNMARIILCVCALFLGGCGASSADRLTTWMQENGKLKVLSTTAMIDDLVMGIGQERVDHLALITGEIDPHSYELVKGDDEKLCRAHLVFFNGLGLEHGASLRYHLQRHPGGVALGEVIQVETPDAIIWVDGHLDPHIWMDISLWMRAIKPIADALSRLDPENSAFFQKNADSLRERMALMHARIYDNLQSVPEEKRFLVTSHDAFNYFARAYLATTQEREGGDWRPRCQAPEGLAPDGQLSSQDLQRTIQHLCMHQLSVLFSESNVSRDALRKIVLACREKGVGVRLCAKPLYGDAMGPGGYLQMIEHNAQTMQAEWQGQWR